MAEHRLVFGQVPHRPGRRVAREPGAVTVDAAERAIAARNASVSAVRFGAARLALSFAAFERCCFGTILRIYRSSFSNVCNGRNRRRGAVGKGLKP